MGQFEPQQHNSHGSETAKAIWSGEEAEKNPRINYQGKQSRSRNGKTYWSMKEAREHPYRAMNTEWTPRKCTNKEKNKKCVYQGVTIPRPEFNTFIRENSPGPVWSDWENGGLEGGTAREPGNHCMDPWTEKPKFPGRTGAAQITEKSLGPVTYVFGDCGGPKYFTVIT